MACPTYTQPSRSRRTVVVVGLEQTPGCVRTDGLEQILLYENPNPLQAEFDTFRLNRLRNGLAPEGIAVGVGTFRFTGSLYMFGSGIPNVPPAWSKILRACGFNEVRYVTDTAPDISTLDEVEVEGSVGTNGAGFMASGTYKYKFSLIPATAASGETKNSAPVQTVDPNHAADGGIITTATDTEGSVSIDWDGSSLDVAGAKVRIYRTKAGGSTYFFVAEVASEHAIGTNVQGHTTTNAGYLDTLNDDNLADPIPTDDVSLEYVAWKPLNEGHASLTMFNYLDSRKYTASGTRGTISFSGNFGEPFRGDINLQGVYNASSEVVNPAFLSTPGFPPRLIKTSLTLAPAGGGAAYTPVVKSITLDTGVQVTARGDTNANEGIIEYGVFQEFQPRVRLQIEVDGAKDWIDEFKTGSLYRIGFTVSPLGVTDSTAGTRIQVLAGDDPANADDGTGGNSAYHCQLISPPVFDDNNGVRVFNLEFEPGEIDEGDEQDVCAFYKIRQY
jgi:hypothetical protein